MSHLRRLFAGVALALIVAPLLASAPLFDPDEGLHAAIAQEMLQRGDYVTPTFRGEPFLDKPILFFWAEAASLRLFGRHEAAVRIPPLLFGLFGMITVALLGRALFDESAGLLAGIVYGTMVLPMGVSEVAVHDVGVVPFMCLAALCLVHVDNGGSIWKAGLVAGVALGLSILTKGLVGVVFTGILAVCLTVRRPASWLGLRFALALAVAVAVAVAAPWYIAMEHAHPGYLHYYFVERHLRGYLTATQRHAGRPLWYYVPIVLGGALPWTAYLAGALRDATRGPRASPEAGRRLVLWGWFATGLVFLSIGESKLVTYALPLFPALALIVGEYVARRHAVGGGPVDPLFRMALVAQAAALALLPAIGLLLLKWKFDEMRPQWWFGILLVSLLIAFTARRAFRSSSEYGVIDGIVRVSVMALFGLMIVAPRAAAWMTSRDLAAALNTAGALPSRVWVVDERIGSLIFYLDPALRAEASADRVDTATFPEAMTRLRVDPPDALLAVRNSQLPRFLRMFPSPPAAEAHAGTFTVFRVETLRATAGVR
jgi:hypothetical protein